MPNQTKPNHPRLKRDDLGICVYSSIHAVATKHASEPDTQSPRDRRMVSLLNFLHDFFQFFRVVSNVYCIAFNYVIIVHKSYDRRKHMPWGSRTFEDGRRHQAHAKVDCTVQEKEARVRAPRTGDAWRKSP